MIRIALIHTVKSVYESFDAALRQALTDCELKTHNVLDEFLASDAAPSEKGCFTLANRQRLLHQLQAAALTEADLIVTTCSQLSSAAEDMAPIIGVPLITIDHGMISRALQKGNRIALISSAEGTVAPISETIRRMAERMSVPVCIRVYCDQRAIEALKAGDREEHDRRIEALAHEIHDCDTAIIAQASGAHMGGRVAEIAGIETFTSVESCIGEICAFVREHGA